MAILESHRQLVNDAIQSLGIDPALCQQEENNNLWKLHRGTAQIIIVAQDSTTHNEDKISTISMMSPVVQIPENFEQLNELYEYILDANHQLIVESFSLSNRWVILSSTYFIDDMRRQEIVQLLDGLSFHAQAFQASLAEKFDF